MPCQPYVYGAEHGENISLDKGHKALQGIQEHPEEHAHNRHSSAKERAVFGHYENDTYHAEYHNMTCQHIGKETDSEGYRLHYGAENLYDRHYGFKEARNIRGKNLLIIVLGTVEIHCEEGTEGQNKGNGNITCEIGPAREEL